MTLIHLTRLLTLPRIYNKMSIFAESIWQMIRNDIKNQIFPIVFPHGHFFPRRYTQKTHSADSKFVFPGFTHQKRNISVVHQISSLSTILFTRLRGLVMSSFPLMVKNKNLGRKSRNQKTKQNLYSNDLFFLIFS